MVKDATELDLAIQSATKFDNPFSTTKVFLELTGTTSTLIAI